jgi:hypothetical protein
MRLADLSLALLGRVDWQNDYSVSQLKIISPENGK